MTERHHLLPPNASPLERAASSAIEKARSSGVPGENTRRTSAMAA